MKKISIVCLTALMSCAAALVNCEAALAQEKEMRYENALNFRMINKGVPDGVTSNPYQRYPDALKDSVVTQLWNTATNSAGLGIRFTELLICVVRLSAPATPILFILRRSSTEKR